ncbi:hypothetical protein [Streptomyces axinellae]|uniref:Uncharacterized protein n=1 Tax=Streptomyces axinellae TaxID=552788 RepID=A0ABN3QM44_9ACTN
MTARPAPGSAPMLPGCGELPANPPRRRRRTRLAQLAIRLGRIPRIHDLPDIANYQPKETR